MRGTIERLVEAAENGEILSIRYERGSQPGAVRDVIPLQVVDGRYLEARCVATNAFKTFLVEYVAVLDGIESATYVPRPKPTKQTPAPSQKKPRRQKLDAVASGMSSGTLPRQARGSNAPVGLRMSVAMGRASEFRPQVFVEDDVRVAEPVAEITTKCPPAGPQPLWRRLLRWARLR